MTESSILLQPSENPRRIQLLWGYLQHEILYLVWFLMELALLTPFLATVLPFTRIWSPGLFLVWLLLLAYLPFNLVRLMSTMDWPRSRQQVILATAVFLVYFLSMRTLFYQPASFIDLRWLGEFFSGVAEPGNLDWLRNLGWFFLVVFIWWRGIRLVGKEFYIEKVGQRMRVGGLLIAPFVIWASFTRVSWSVVPFLLIFFLVSLTAVALTRVEEVEKQQSGKSSSLNPKWLIFLTISALLVILAALLLTYLVSGDTMLTFSSWLDPLWRAIIIGGTISFNTLFNLLAPIFEALFGVFDWLLSLISPMMSNLTDIVPDTVESLFLIPPEEIDEAPIDVIDRGGFKTINLLLMIAVVLFVTLALGKLYRRTNFATRENESATRTNTTSAKDSKGLGLKLLKRLGLLRGWRTAASIRHIYQNMCRAATASGYPRAEAETPFEYLKTLDKAWPNNRSDTQLVTEAYVKVRYGELPETQAELEAIRAAWKRLEMTPPFDQEQPQKVKVDLDPLN